ncbi:FecR domain-containing protein [candidate division KSB1 bacterium]|nr:FecR domain-containing protein [candidate division KSB1 bacterium]
MNKSVYIFIVAVFVMATIPLTTAAALDPEIAFVLKVTGNAKVKTESTHWTDLSKGMRLHSGDQIRTGANTLVAIIFIDDKTMVKIRSDSEIRFTGEKVQKGIAKKLAMDIGDMWARVTPGGAGFRLETPSGVAAVKGTEFYGITDSSGETIIIGIEGFIEFFNELGSILIGKGQTGSAAKGGKPVLTETPSFDDWAKTDTIDELDIEFENSEGVKKHLKIRYKQK